MSKIYKALLQPSATIDRGKYSLIHPIILNITLLAIIFFAFTSETVYIVLSAILFYIVTWIPALFTFITWDNRLEDPSKDAFMIKKIFMLSGIMMISSLLILYFTEMNFISEERFLGVFTLFIIIVILSIFLSLQSVILLFDVNHNAKKFSDFISLIIIGLITTSIIFIAFLIVYNVIFDAIRLALTVGGTF